MPPAGDAAGAAAIAASGAVLAAGAGAASAAGGAAGAAGVSSFFVQETAAKKITEDNKSFFMRILSMKVLRSFVHINKTP